MEKSGCTFKDYSLFPCWCQQTAADCSQRCSRSCTRKPNADLLTLRQRVALFPVLDWTTWKKWNGENIVRNIKAKGGIRHKHDDKHRSTHQECWLTACSSCFWLWASLKDAVRFGSTQQKTKDRQTNRRDTSSSQAFRQQRETLGYEWHHPSGANHMLAVNV